MLVGNIITKEPKIIYNEDSNDFSIIFYFKADANNSDGSKIKLDYLIDDNKYSISELTADSDGFYSIRINNVEYDNEITLNVYGVHTVGEKVFFYEAENGRKASQSLIGSENIEFPISKTIVAKTPTINSGMDEDNNNSEDSGNLPEKPSVGKGN